MISELTSKLRAYINGDLSDKEFSVWFYRFSRVAEKRFIGTALDFVYLIQGTFAEASSGGWSKEDLLQELEIDVNNYSDTLGIVGVTWDIPERVIRVSQPQVRFAFQSV